MRKIICYFLISCAFLVLPLSSIGSIGEKNNQNIGTKFSSEDSAKSLVFLKKQIHNVIKKYEGKHTNLGIAIYSLDKNDYYFKYNFDSYFIPASLTKLFTTVAALNKFGPNFLVKTSVYASGKITNGVLYGNLYIYGRGDALLSSSDIDLIAEKIKSSGIKHITGGVVADPTFFDSQTDRFIYSGDADVVQKTQPITSLSLEKNVINVIVTAGSIYGRYVSAQAIPNSEAIRLIVTAKVGRDIGHSPLQKQTMEERNYGDQNVLLAQHKQTRHPVPTSRDKKKFTVSSSVNQEGIQEIVVSGNLPAGSSRTYSFFIENPPLVVAGALKSRLVNLGVRVDGPISEGQVNFESVSVVIEFERRLIDILVEMDKNSENYLAETVFKMLGAYDKKMTSNSKEAIRYIFALLDSLQIPCLECKMYDGSGLSRRNRFSPESIIYLLKFAMSNPRISLIDSLLPISGYDGTLKTRMLGTRAEGRVFAKTGTHSNASGLAGFVRTLDNERLVFAFMFNGELVGTYKKIEDELCQILAEFFYFHQVH